MKALLAGIGGIGENVYYPELKKLGYNILTLDPNKEANYKDYNEIKDGFDIAVISTPNFTHGQIAHHLANCGTKRIFVEKPGLGTAFDWNELCRLNDKTQFHLVKNNLYRDNYGHILALMQTELNEIIGVDINWLNDNRIPNPGSWFTTKHLSFGGVSKDLMPHLYCFAIKLFGLEKLKNSNIKQACFQRWNLNTIYNTNYGIVNQNGTYNVDDTAMVAGNIGNITLKMTASWKEGYNKQSITLFFKDGTTYEWEFGLCPSEAYGTMLQDTSNTDIMDLQIHKFLEAFDD